MRLRKFIILTALLVIVTGFEAPDPFMERLGNGLKKFTEEFPQEKAYLHTDRPYYLAGETLWFKAYLTAGSFNQLSPISRTLYIELINENKEKLNQSMIRVNEGTGNGDILLPSDLKSGNYLLRAYTNWMRNFDEEFFYSEEIKIWNIDEKISPSGNSTNALDVQFFPEGGHLVAGIKSNVAFKAIGSDGLSRNVKGKIISSKGITVAEFNSNHLGMGVISFIPENGETYTAEVEEQKDKNYSLPKVEDQGFVITVTNKEDAPEVIVKIQSTESTPRPQTLTLAAHHRGEPSFVAQVNFANVIFFAKIPKTKLLHGLTHLTLFDSNGKPQCERLVFIDKEEQLQISVTGLKKNYKPREKVEFEISTTDKNGNAVPASLSLTALNINEVALDSHGKSIENYLQLSSDLKGNIESPGYYFDRNNTDRHTKLDLLLLTQGWTRFSWEKILNNQWPEVNHYIEQGINLQGALLDDLNDSPVEGGKVTFFTTDNLTDIVVAATGKQGRFIFDDLVFYDSSTAVLQGQNKKGKNFVKFILDPILPAQEVNHTINSTFDELTSYERTLITKGEERRKIDESYRFEGKTIMLEGVEVIGKQIDPTQETRVYKGASKSIKSASTPGSAYMNHPLELIRGVAGIQLRPDPPGYTVTIRGTGTISAGAEPLFLLDNMPIPIGTLNTIPVQTIESVDIFRGAESAVFGVQGANGVIAFFSKKGGAGLASIKGIYNFDLNGYYTAQEFYAPKYDIQKPEHVKPDRRVTLSWQPNIITDESGKTKVSFYNPDPESPIVINVQGITKNGLPGTQRAGYEIKKD